MGEYRGKPTFIAHSCGHDIHMAAWVGTAEALVALKDRWSGTLMFIAQPAEEAVGGAKAMVADGLFTRFPKPTYGFALHGGPAAYGTVSWKPGVMNTNADSIEINFKGRGGHGSMPQQSIDPVTDRVQVRCRCPERGQPREGPAGRRRRHHRRDQRRQRRQHHPRPRRGDGDHPRLRPAVRAKLIAGVKRTAMAEAMMAGAPEPEINIGEDQADAVINDQSLADRTAPVFKAAFGELAEEVDTTRRRQRRLLRLRRSRRALALLRHRRLRPGQGGGGKSRRPAPRLQPLAVLLARAEPTIRTGVEAMTLAVMNVMGKGDLDCGQTLPSSFHRKSCGSSAAHRVETFAGTYELQDAALRGPLEQQMSRLSCSPMQR